jgi:hypothetical protein
MLFRDDNDETYALLSGRYVYENPTIDAAELARRFFQSCVVRVQAARDRAPAAPQI